MNDMNTAMPDPSTLTTQQLWREVASLKELLETRIEAMDRAIKVAHEDTVRFPTEVQNAVSTLRELHGEKFEGIRKELDSMSQLRDEKFKGVQTQFEERDVRVAKTATDTKTAVDAALQAAKELVAQQNISAAQSAAKQEASFSKQIDAQGILIQATAKASDEKIDDIKQRLTRIESKGDGSKETTARYAVLIGVIASIIGIIAFFTK